MNMKHYISSFALLSFIFICQACTYEIIESEKDCTIAPDLFLVSSTDTNCSSEEGEIVVDVTDQEGTPMVFKLNGEQENVTGRFENLSAGNYLVTVETINGCASSLAVEVRNLSGLSISVETINADCEGNSGSISITAVGGEAPYQYKIGNEAFQTDNTFGNLATGEYTLVAEDASGCQVTQEVEISAEVSFSSIQSIIQASCVSSGCHGGNVNPDFRNTNNIIDKAARIKARTSGGSMPPASSGKSLTDDEVALISCWVDNGAKQ